MAALLSVILLTLVWFWPLPVAADWRCDGDPLSVETVAGAVDPTGLPGGIPNTSAGTLPGDGVLIRWRGLTLQLPRTTNAGPPSYTDGRWWWRVEDPLRPEFLQRRGSIVAYDCEPLA
ncbi:hypothetical protein SynA1528_01435 [Synechococcus sp. A15-28]|nr:hypothetical protein SynA1528_01435 [Synechococcus sp. A15-28]